MDKKLARALSISLGKYANESTKKKKQFLALNLYQLS